MTLLRWLIWVVLAGFAVWLFGLLFGEAEAEEEFIGTDTIPGMGNLRDTGMGERLAFRARLAQLDEDYAAQRQQSVIDRFTPTPETRTYGVAEDELIVEPLTPCTAEQAGAQTFAETASGQTVICRYPALSSIPYWMVV